MTTEFEQKQAARKAHLEAAADAAETRANQAYSRADMSEAATGIPLGQPILVGHHSERRHRAAIARADRAMSKSIEESKRADQLRAKAASVGKGGISSDDPDAIAKLKTKLDKITEQQAHMKTANTIIRRWYKKGVTHETTGAQFDAYADDLRAVLGYHSKLARELLNPQFGNAGPVGFAPFQLQNNSAEIRRLTKRIAQLEKAQKRQTTHTAIPGGIMVSNVEDNRLQFVFDDKPNAEIRDILKSHGFRWAPSAGAWQRQLTNNARFVAKMVIEKLKA